MITKLIPLDIFDGFAPSQTIGTKRLLLLLLLLLQDRFDVFQRFLGGPQPWITKRSQIEFQTDRSENGHPDLTWPHLPFNSACPRWTTNNFTATGHVTQHSWNDIAGGPLLEIVTFKSENAEIRHCR